ncbi:hypothetical protein VVD49_06425 [Uliginosibacterium sp. H3]|uniref:Uncharacterized protein n=1 Tax=Uliginosibacterium silvisoli TaxID=3114758 RepID=A0ABU6K103_9RHOO|nr:hypothetical protein [Uliginosibacterium sp. H3]
MPTPDRHIRHMHLTAGSEADVRSVLPRLEDALRCASLPDGGARLRVVRKLALGNIARGMSSQHLSRIIEQRMAEVGAQWVAGGTPTAEHAGFVDFPGVLDARIQLALRLLRGDACNAWYWPLAVQEFQTQQTVGSNLRSMAQALSVLPEAQAALPAWVLALVEAGAAPLLVAALDQADPERLLQEAGIAMLPSAPSGVDEDEPRAVASDAHDAEPAPQGVHGQQQTFRARHADDAVLRALPLWLRSLLVASKAARFQFLRDSDALQSTQLVVTRPVGEVAQVRSVPVRTDKDVPVAPGQSDTDDLMASTENAEGIARPSADPQVAYEDSDEVHIPAHEAADIQPATPTSEARATQDPLFARSTSAGLFFLLPVLVRLGLVQWAESNGHDAGQFASRVLVMALRRLRVAEDEPTLAVLGSMVSMSPSGVVASTAPASWADALLRSPQAQPAASLVAALAAATTIDAQAQVWLCAARRWLRRAGGIGLASLVLRPGRVGSTPTHIDIYFSVNAIDMRVRRAGLDIDPGWLSWLGKVVSYHYVRGLA